MNIAIAGNEEPMSDTLLGLLQTRSFPIDQLYVLTSLDEFDQAPVQFQEQTLPVQNTKEFDWSQVHLLFLLGNDPSYGEVLAAAQAQHCRIIDLRNVAQKSTEHPLTLLNHAIPDAQVLVSPDDMTVLLAQMIEPLFEETALVQLNVVTLDPVSVHGPQGSKVLAKEVAQLMNGRPVEAYEFGAQQAFNTIPAADSSCIRRELQALFPEENLSMSVTQLQVPVFFGTTAIIDMMLEDPLPRDVIVSMLEKLENVELTDELITPVTHAAEQNRVFIQFVAPDLPELQSYRLLIVTDPLKLGRVYNAVTLAEQLVAETQGLVH
jgi:aspartate-semialdehyde dehydrogenase